MPILTLGSMLISCAVIDGGHVEDLSITAKTVPLWNDSGFEARQSSSHCGFRYYFFRTVIRKAAKK